MRMTSDLLLRIEKATQLSADEIFQYLLLTVVALLLLVIALTAMSLKWQSQGMSSHKGSLREGALMIHTVFRHIYGLPLLENSTCEIFTYADRIEFKSGTTSMKLARNKIIDMHLKTAATTCCSGGCSAFVLLSGPLVIYRKPVRSLLRGIHSSVEPLACNRVLHLSGLGIFHLHRHWFYRI